MPRLCLACVVLLACSLETSAQEPTTPAEPSLLPMFNSSGVIPSSGGDDQAEQPGREPAAVEPATPAAPNSKPTPQDSLRAEIMAAAAKKFGVITPIKDVGLNGARLAAEDEGKLPEMFALTDASREVRYDSPPLHRPWENLVLRPHAQHPHHPLYFEEANLERYGVRRRFVQPACSAAHFFGSVAMLPYQTTLHRPHQSMYFRRPYLPGVNGLESTRRPLRLGPALVQAGVATGLMFIAP